VQLIKMKEIEKNCKNVKHIDLIYYLLSE